MDEQLMEMISLWHKIILKDQDPDIIKKYSNFVDLSTNEISVINIVYSNPQVIMRDICTILGLPKSTLTNVINRLEKKGYLNRTISKQDLRSYGLELTTKGQQVQKEHTEYELELFGEVIESLNKEEREQLIKIMSKISNSKQ